MKRLVTSIREKFKSEEVPPDLEEEFLLQSSIVSDFTLTSLERQYAVWSAVRYLEKANIKGDFVECGVWKGGSTMLMALALLALQSTKRKLFLFDTFSGMSEPTEADVSHDGTRVTEVWDSVKGDRGSELLAAASLDEVRSNIESTGYPSELCRYVKGMVEETIPDEAPEKIALLRLDTDWYESTRHELEELWPRLVMGGVLIIDDYGHWQGARKAVDEFFSSSGREVLLSRIDYTGRLVVKVSGG